MNVEGICKIVGKLFDRYLRPPIKPINPFLIWCSAFMRPGLSVNLSVSNILCDLAKRGIPTEEGPDGQPNFVNKLVYSMTNEIFRAIREDMVVQASTPPGMMSTVQVAFPAGTGTAVSPQAQQVRGIAS